jgi:hypothetical protein
MPESPKPKENKPGIFSLLKPYQGLITLVLMIMAAACLPGYRSISTQP